MTELSLAPKASATVLNRSYSGIVKTAMQEIGLVTSTQMSAPRSTAS
jgi:hypothetical protein